MQDRTDQRKPAAGVGLAGVAMALLLVLAGPAWGQEIPALPGFPGAGPAEEQAPSEPLPIEPAEDAQLEQRLRGIYERVERFRGVEVAVDQGVVRLTGTVARMEGRELAEQIARRFEGVVYVDNQMEVDRDLEARVAPAARAAEQWVQRTIGFLPTLAVALAVVGFFALVAWAVTRLIRPYRWARLNPLMAGLLRRIVGSAIVLVGVLLALEILDVTALFGAVIGGAGLLGLAIGFAFRSVAENYLAGLLLSLRRPFAIGDLVDIAEHRGLVLRLTSRETVLIGLDAQQVRIPNATVFASVIVNHTATPRRRFEFAVFVAWEANLKRVQSLGREAMGAMRGVLPDPPPIALVEAVTADHVEVRFYGWMRHGEADYFKVRSEAIRLVKRTLEEADVPLPTPTYHVRLRRGPEPVEAGEPVTEPMTQEAQAADVQPGGELEGQLDEARQASRETNLLEGRDGSK